jgi:hypothetical protein
VVGWRLGPDGGVGDSSWWRRLAWTKSSIGHGLLVAPAPARCMRRWWAPDGSCSVSGVATAAASVKIDAWPGGLGGDLGRPRRAWAAGPLPPLRRRFQCRCAVAMVVGLQGRLVLPTVAVVLRRWQVATTMSG